MRKAVAGRRETGDLLARSLSSEEFTPLLRNHRLQSYANFESRHFPFHGGGRRAVVAVTYGLGLVLLRPLFHSSALSLASALASIEKWVDLLNGPRLWRP